MQVTTPCMTETETPDYFIAPMSSGWTRFENSIYGDYDTSGCRPGLIAYLGKSEKALYPVFVRLTTGYNRTWTRVSLSNLQVLTGLSRNPVIKAVQSLVDSGLIESRNNGGVTEYRVVTENALPFIAAKNAENRREKCTSENPASAGNEPNWRVKRAEVVEKTRQNSAGNEPPTRKEINNEKKKKKHVAPKNGAAESGENPLTDSPQNQSSEVNVNSGAVTAPPSCENPPPADKPRSAKQLAHDAKMTAFAEGLGLDINIKSACGKILKAIGELNENYGKETVTPDLISRVIATLKNPETGYVPEPAKVVEKWLSVTETLTAMDTQKGVIDQIKAICLEPTGGWQSQAAGLVATADRIIANVWQDKLSGFEWWGEGKPSLKAFVYALPEFINKKEGNHGTKSTSDYGRTGRTNERQKRQFIDGESTPKPRVKLTSEQLFA